MDHYIRSYLCHVPYSGNRSGDVSVLCKIEPKTWDQLGTKHRGITFKEVIRILQRHRTNSRIEYVNKENLVLNKVLLSLQFRLIDLFFMLPKRPLFGSFFIKKRRIR